MAVSGGGDRSSTSGWQSGEEREKTAERSVRAGRAKASPQGRPIPPPSLCRKGEGHRGGRKEWGGDGLSESRQQGERTKKHIFSQLRLLYFPYRSLLWALCSILAVISQVQVTAITGLMAAVASSLVSLVSPSFLHPFMVCFPHKVRGIFKNKFRSYYCPLKILQLYHTTINGGFELWSSSPSAGTHSDPRGRDAVPIPSCCECDLPLALENHPLPKDLMCPNSDMPPFLGAAHSQTDGTWR